MASSKKSSTPRTKPPKGRPTSTSTIAHPAHSDALSILSAFSPDANLFAFVVLAVDKHRLRVYDTTSGRAISEHTVESGRITALAWGTLIPDSSNQEPHSPSKKRKKTSAATSSISNEKETAPHSTVIVLGLSDGTVLFFSPSHSKILRTLAHPTITSAILSLAFDPIRKSYLWTSSTDSTICLWDAQKKAVLRSWKNDDRIPCTSLLARSTPEDEITDLLAAHHSIRFFTDISSEESSLGKPRQSLGFTGHATSVKSLLWSKESQEPTKFFSSAEGDRFIYYWNTEGASSTEKPIASTSLDSDVRTIVLATTTDSEQSLIALSTSGKLSFIPVPAEFPASSDKSQKINTLLPRSTVASVSKSSPLGPPVVDLIPLSGQTGIVRVVRLVKGFQPTFDTIRYLDDNGNYIQNPALDEINNEGVNQGPESATNKRYVEPKTLAVGSGYDISQGENVEGSSADHEVDGSLQVDLAEMSLGQRLTALTDADANLMSESEDDDNATENPRRPKSTKKSRTEITAIPTNSLTRTLIQALHSSDSRLLEMCLAHSDPGLILNTVRRLPPQLAIPLISACVDRLGRGPRSANMKGGGGGASSQRGLGLLVWLRTVLTVHTGHLMTIPDLVARLSGLHAALNARLSLHDSLLSLSGRLDMVLSQVELRASTAPASLAPSKADKRRPEALVKRYVEGDTDSSDEQDDAKMDVEIEAESDEGSIEDIELGGDSEDEDEEDESSDSDGGGFIDDEAEEEEYTGDEDEDESE